MMAKLYKAVDPESLAQLADFFGSNPEFLQQFFSTIEENENLIPPVESEDVEKILQDRGTDADVIDAIKKLSENLTPAEIGTLLQLQIDLPSEEFEKILELAGENPEAIAKILDGRPKDVHAKVGDLVACEKSMDPEVLEQLLNHLKPLDKPKLQALLAASAIEPEAISSILDDNKLETKDVEILTDVLSHLLEDQEKANVLSSVKNLEPEELKKLLKMCEQFPESASHMLASPDLQPENIRALLAAKDSLNDDEMKKAMQLCKDMTEPELTQFLDLKTQDPQLWDNLMADQTPNVDNVKNILKLQQSLPVEDFEKLLSLKDEVAPDEFQKLLKLAASNPMFMEELLAVGIEPKVVTELLDHYPTKDSDLLHELLEAAQLLPSKTVDGLTKCIREDPGSMENIVDITELLGPEAVSKILETFQGKTLDEATNLLQALEANQTKKRSQTVVTDPRESLKALENTLTESEFENVQNLLNVHPDEINRILSSTDDVALLNEVMQKLGALESVLPEDQFRALLDKGSYMKPEQLLNLLNAAESEPNVLAKILSPAAENQESIDALVDFCGNCDSNCMPQLLKLVDQMEPQDLDDLADLCSKNPKSMENIVTALELEEARRLLDEILKLCETLSPKEKEKFLDLYSKLPESYVDDVMELLRNHPDLKDFILKNNLTPEEVCAIAEAKKHYPQEEFDQILELQDKLTDEEFSKVLNLLPYNQNTLSAIMEECKENPEAISELLEMFPSNDSLALKDILAGLKSLPNATVEALSKQMLESPEAFTLLAKLQDTMDPQQVSELLQSIQEKEEKKAEVLKDVELKLPENERQELAELIEFNPDVINSLLNKGADKDQMESIAKMLVSSKHKLPEDQMNALMALGENLTPGEFEKLLKLAVEEPEKMTKLLDPESASSNLIQELLKDGILSPENLLNLLDNLEAEEIERLAELQKSAPEVFKEFIEQCDKSQPSVSIFKALAKIPDDEATTLMHAYAALPEKDKKLLSEILGDEIFDEHPENVLLCLKNTDLDKVLQAKKQLSPQDFEKALQLRSALADEGSSNFWELTADNPNLVSDETVSRLAEKHPIEMEALLKSGADAETLRDIANNLSSLEDKLSEDQIASLLQLSGDIEGTDFNNLLKYFNSNPEKVDNILEKIKNDPESFKTLLDLCSSSEQGSETPRVENVLDCLDILDPNQIKHLADLATQENPSNAEKILLSSSLEPNLPRILIEAASDLSPEEQSNLIKLSEAMSPSKVAQFAKILTTEPELKKMLGNPDDMNLEQAQFLVKAKEVLSDDDFDKLVKQQNNLTPDEVAKLNNLLQKSPDEFQKLVNNSTGNEDDFKNALEKVPEAIETSLASISKSLEDLDPEKVAKLAKLLETNPSLAELILDQLASTDPDANDGMLEVIRILGKTGETLTDEQLENLKNLKNIQDPEVFDCFIKLMEKDPEKAKQLLESKEFLAVASKDLIDLAETLHPLELENLVAFAGTVDKDEMKNFLELNKEGEPNNCQLLLQSGNFDPLVAKQISALSQSLNPGQVEKLLELSQNLSPEDFQQLLALKESSPEDFQLILQKDEEAENKAKLVSEALKTLNALKETGPETILNLAKLAESLDADKVETLANLSQNEEAFPRLIESCGGINGSVEVLANASELLGQEGIDKLGFILAENPEALKNLLLDENLANEGFLEKLIDLQKDLAMTIVNEDAILGPTGAKSLESSVPVEGLQKKTDPVKKIFETQVGNERRKFITDTLASLKEKLDEDELEALSKLGDNIPSKQFDLILKLAKNNPEKFQELLKPEDGKTPLEALIEMCNDSSHLNLEFLGTFVENLDSDQLKQLAALQMESPEVVKSLSREILEKLSKTSGSLTPDQVSNLLKVSSDLQPEEILELLKMIESEPAFKTEMLGSPDLDSAQVKLLMQAKNVLPQEEFEKLLSVVKDLQPNDIEKMAELLKTEPSALRKTLQENEKNLISALKKTFDEIPDDKKASLDKIARVLESLPKDKLDKFAKYLETNPSDAEKILDLPPEELEKVLSDILKEIKDEPTSLADILSVKQDLPHAKDKLSNEQLRNLAELKKNSDPEVFNKFLQLLDENPYSVGQILQGNVDKDMPLEAFVDVASKLNKEEIENLVKLTKTLDPEQLKDFLSLDGQNDGEDAHCQKFLQKDPFNPEAVDQFLELQKILTPEEKDAMLKLNTDPKLFAFLVGNPDKAKELLEKVDGDIDSLQKLTSLCSGDEPLSAEQLVNFINNTPPDDLKKVAQLANENPQNLKVLMNANPSDPLASAQLKVSNGLADNEIAKLAEICSKMDPEEAKAFLQMLESDPELKKQLLLSPSFDAEEAKLLTKAKQILPESEFAKLVKMRDSMSPEEVAKLNSLLESQATSVVDLLKNSDPKKMDEIKEALKQIPDDKKASLDKIARILESLPKDKLDRFAKYLETNPSVAEKILDLPPEELEKVLSDILKEIEDEPTSLADILSVKQDLPHAKDKLSNEQLRNLAELKKNSDPEVFNKFLQLLDENPYSVGQILQGNVDKDMPLEAFVDVASKLNKEEIENLVKLTKTLDPEQLKDFLSLDGQNDGEDAHCQKFLQKDPFNPEAVEQFLELQKILTPEEKDVMLKLNTDPELFAFLVGNPDKAKELLEKVDGDIDSLQKLTSLCSGDEPLSAEQLVNFINNTHPDDLQKVAQLANENPQTLKVLMNANPSDPLASAQLKVSNGLADNEIAKLAEICSKMDPEEAKAFLQMLESDPELKKQLLLSPSFDAKEAKLLTKAKQILPESEFAKLVKMQDSMSPEEVAKLNSLLESQPTSVVDLLKNSDPKKMDEIKEALKQIPDDKEASLDKIARILESLPKDKLDRFAKYLETNPSVAEKILDLPPEELEKVLSDILKEIEDEPTSLADILSVKQDLPHAKDKLSNEQLRNLAELKKNSDPEVFNKFLQLLDENPYSVGQILQGNVDKDMPLEAFVDVASKLNKEEIENLVKLTKTLDPEQLKDFLSLDGQNDGEDAHCQKFLQKDPFNPEAVEQFLELQKILTPEEKDAMLKLNTDPKLFAFLVGNPDKAKELLEKVDGDIDSLQKLTSLCSGDEPLSAEQLVNFINNTPPDDLKKVAQLAHENPQNLKVLMNANPSDPLASAQLKVSNGLADTEIAKLAEICSKMDPEEAKAFLQMLESDPELKKQLLLSPSFDAEEAKLLTKAKQILPESEFAKLVKMRDSMSPEEVAKLNSLLESQPTSVVDLLKNSDPKKMDEIKEALKQIPDDKKASLDKIARVLESLPNDKLDRFAKYLETNPSVAEKILDLPPEELEKVLSDILKEIEDEPTSLADILSVKQDLPHAKDKLSNEQLRNLAELKKNSDPEVFNKFLQLLDENPYSVGQILQGNVDKDMPLEAFVDVASKLNKEEIENLVKLTKTLDPEQLKDFLSLDGQNDGEDAHCQKFLQKDPFNPEAVEQFLELQKILTPEEKDAMLKLNTDPKLFAFLVGNPDKAKELLEKVDGDIDSLQKLTSLCSGDEPLSAEQLVNFINNTPPDDLKKVAQLAHENPQNLKVLMNANPSDPLASAQLKVSNGLADTEIAKLAEICSKMDPEEAKAFLQMLESDPELKKQLLLSPSFDAEEAKLLTKAKQILPESEFAKLVKMRDSMSPEEVAKLNSLLESQPTSVVDLLKNSDPKKMDEIKEALKQIPDDKKASLDKIARVLESLPKDKLDRFAKYLETNPSVAEKILDLPPEELEKVLSDILKEIEDEPTSLADILSVKQDLPHAKDKLSNEQLRNLAELKKNSDPEVFNKFLQLLDENPYSVGQILQGNVDKDMPLEAFVDVASKLNKEEIENLVKLTKTLDPEQLKDFLSLDGQNDGEDAHCQKILQKDPFNPEAVEQFLELQKILTPEEKDVMLKLNTDPELFAFLVSNPDKAKELLENVDGDIDSLQKLTSLCSGDEPLSAEQLVNFINNTPPDDLKKVAQLANENPQNLKVLMNANPSDPLASAQLKVSNGLADNEIAKLADICSKMDPEEAKAFLQMLESDPELKKQLLLSPSFDAEEAKLLTKAKQILPESEFAKLVKMRDSMSPEEVAKLNSLLEAQPTSVVDLLKNSDSKKMDEIKEALKQIPDDKKASLDKIARILESLPKDKLDRFAKYLETNPSVAEKILDLPPEELEKVLSDILKEIEDEPTSLADILSVKQDLSHAKDKLSNEQLRNLAELKKNSDPEVFNKFLQLLDENPYSVGQILQGNVDKDMPLEAFVDVASKLNKEEIENLVKLTKTLDPEQLKDFLSLDGQNDGEDAHCQKFLQKDPFNPEAVEQFLELQKILTPEEKDAMLKLNTDPKLFDFLVGNPDKAKELLEKVDGDIDSLQKLTSLCSGDEPLSAEQLVNFINNTPPEDLKKVAQLANENPQNLKVLMNANPSDPLASAQLKVSNGLADNEIAKLAEICSKMDPEEAKAFVQMLESDPELKKQLLLSPSFDAEEAKLLTKAKQILPESEFAKLVKMQDSMSPEEVAKLNSLLEAQPTSVVDLLKNSDPKKMDEIKEALKQIPDDKKASLDKIARVLESLPKDKLDRFAKYLETNPSVAEKILDLPPEELEKVLSDILKEIEDEPTSLADILSVKQDLPHAKDKLSNEQLRNLAELKRNSDPEVFNKFLQLLDENPYSVGQILQGNVDKDMPLEAFVDVASKLNKEEIENLVKLTKTLDPEQLKDFLSLDGQNDGEDAHCQKFLQKDPFNPEAVEQFLELQKILAPEEKDVMLKLNTDPELFAFLVGNPDKAKELLEKVDGDIDSLQKLTSLCSGDEPLSAEQLVNFINNTPPEDLKKVAQLANENPQNLKVLMNANPSDPLASAQLKVSNGLADNEIAKLAEICSKMDPEEAKAFLQMLESDPELKKQLLLSPSFDAEEAKLLSKAKQILPESEFAKLVKMQDSMSPEEVAKLNSLLEAQPTSVVDLLKNSDPKKMDEIKEALKQIPDDKKASLDKIARVLESLPKDKLDRFAKYLETNPSVAEKILDLPPEELEKVLADILKEIEDEPTSLADILSVKQDLPHAKDKLSNEQLRNLAELKKNSDPEVFNKFLQLLDENPYSVGQILQGNVDKDMPLEAFVDVASKLNKEEIENLVKLTKTLDPEQLKDFLSLDGQNDGEDAHCQKFLQKDPFNPEAVEQFLELQKILTPEEKDVMLKLNTHPELFAFLVGNPEKAKELLEKVDGDIDSLQKLTSLCSGDEPLSAEQLVNFINNTPPEDLKKVAQLANENPQNLKVLMNANPSDPLASAQLKVSNGLADNEIAKLAEICSKMDPEEAKAFLQMLESDPELKKQLLLSPSFDAEEAKLLTKAKQILPESEFAKLVKMRDSMSPEEVAKLNSLLEAQPTSVVDLLKNSDPKKMDEIKEALKQIPDDKKASLDKIARVLESLPKDKLDRFAKYLETNPSVAEKILDLPPEELEKVLADILKEIEDEPTSLADILSVKQDLPHAKDKLSNEQLRNLAELKRNSDPEVFNKFLQLLDENPYSVGQILQGNVDKDMPLEAFVDVASKLNKEEIENLVKLTKTLDPEQLKDFLSLDGQNDGEDAHCQKILQKDPFNPEAVEQFLELQKILTPEEKDVMLKLNTDPELFAFLVGNPDKAKELLEKVDGDIDSLQKLTSLCSGDEPLSAEQLVNFINNTPPDDLKKVAQLANENPQTLKVLMKANTSDPLTSAQLKVSNGLADNEIAKLAEICSKMDPEEAKAFVQMLKSDPELKKQLLLSPSFDAEEAKLLTKAKQILPESEFAKLVKMQDSMSPEEVAKLNSLLESQPTSVVDLLKNSDPKKMDEIKEALKQIPDDKKASLEKIARVLESLPNDKLDRFAKYLETNPSVAEKILDLPPEELEKVLSDVLKEIEDEPTSLADILSVKQDLPHAKDKLSNEQLRNLAELKKNSDPEVFNKFLQLLDENPYSVGQILQGNVDKDMPLEAFVDVASKLNKEEIENLVKLTKTLDPEQLKDFLSLDGQNDGEDAHCQKFLQKDPFNPEAVEQFLELQKILTPEEKDVMLKLNTDPELFAFLVGNPEKAKELLEKMDGDIDSLQKLTSLCSGDEPWSAEQLVNFINNTPPDDLKKVAQLANENPQNLKVVMNANPSDPLASAQLKVSNGLADNEIAKLAEICSKMDPEEAKAFLQMLESDPELKKQLLLSPSFDAEEAKLLTKAKQILPESEFAKLVKMQDSMSPEEVAKLNSLLEAQPTSVVDLLKNSDPKKMDEIKEALKQIPDDKKASLDKIARVLESLPKDKLDRFAKYLETNPSVAEKLAGFSADELEDILAQDTSQKQVMSPVAMETTLGALRDVITPEQLKNLEEMRKNQDPEVFHKFLELLNGNPESVGKILERNLKDPKMPLDKFNKLAETLNDEELGKLCALSQALDPETFASFLSLDSESDKPKCKSLLKNDNLNPEVIDQILGMKDSLSPDQFNQLTKLQEVLPPEEFEQLLKLKDLNPDDFDLILTPDDVDDKTDAIDEKLVGDTIDKLKHLGETEPESLLNLSKILDKLGAEAVKTLANLSDENGFPDLVQNVGSMPEAIPVLAKIPEVLGKEEIKQLGEILAENPNLLKQLLNGDLKPSDFESSMKTKNMKSEIPGDSDEDDVNKWNDLVDEDAIAGPSEDQKVSSGITFPQVPPQNEMESLKQELEDMATKLEDAEFKLATDNAEKEKVSLILYKFFQI